jgi:hypothetical protein
MFCLLSHCLNISDLLVDLRDGNVESWHFLVLLSLRRLASQARADDGDHNGSTGFQDRFSRRHDLLLW